jgi:hypothetical protein
MVFLCGISEQLDSTDGNLSVLGDDLLGISHALPEQRTDQYPEITRKHAKAGQDQEFRQLSACDIPFVRGMNREFLFP